MRLFARRGLLAKDEQGRWIVKFDPYYGGYPDADYFADEDVYEIAWIATSEYIVAGVDEDDQSTGDAFVFVCEIPGWWVKALNVIGDNPSHPSYHETSEDRRDE